MLNGEREQYLLKLIGDKFREYGAFILFGLVFLLICAVNLPAIIQLPLASIVFGVLVYMQLEHKDRNKRHTYKYVTFCNRFVILVKEEQEAATGDTIKL